MTSKKWADYCISAVRYNEKRTHIEFVKAFNDNGEKLGEEKQYARKTVVDAIEDKTSFVTITKNKDDKWVKGQPVFDIEINKTKFIKTERNEKECDNLESLPEF